MQHISISILMVIIRNGEEHDPEIHVIAKNTYGNTEDIMIYSEYSHSDKKSIIHFVSRASVEMMLSVFEKEGDEVLSFEIDVPRKKRVWDEDIEVGMSVFHMEEDFECAKRIVEKVLMRVGI